MDVTVSPAIVRTLKAWEEACNNARSHAGETVPNKSAEEFTWPAFATQHDFQDLMFNCWHRLPAKEKREVVAYLLGSGVPSEARLLLVLYIHSHLPAVLEQEMMSEVRRRLMGQTMENWWEI